MMQNYQPVLPCAPGGRPPAMVYPVEQQLSRVYEPAQAIRNGTLFPELNKPMHEHMQQIDGPLATPKQAVDFSAWEMRLYLNTHPCDAQALALYKNLCEAAGTPSYACTFVEGAQGGAPCQGSMTRWSWLDNPWPWEKEDNCRVCV